MSLPGASLQPAGPAARRRRGTGRAARVLLALVVLAAVLAAGVALGMSLHDNPVPTGPLTVERTVELAP